VKVNTALFAFCQRGTRHSGDTIDTVRHMLAVGSRRLEGTDENWNKSNEFCRKKKFCKIQNK